MGKPLFGKALQCCSGKRGEGEEARHLLPPCPAPPAPPCPAPLSRQKPCAAPSLKHGTPTAPHVAAPPPPHTPLWRQQPSWLPRTVGKKVYCALQSAAPILPSAAPPSQQVRLGSAKETRGTAFVVYEDIYDAKNAVDHLSGFNVQASGSGCSGSGCSLQLGSWFCPQNAAERAQEGEGKQSWLRGAAGCGGASPRLLQGYSRGQSWAYSCRCSPAGGPPSPEGTRTLKGAYRLSNQLHACPPARRPARPPARPPARRTNGRTSTAATTSRVSSPPAQPAQRKAKGSDKTPAPIAELSRVVTLEAAEASTLWGGVGSSGWTGPSAVASMGLPGDP